MGFIKKILVLKEIDEGFSISGKRLSGICRIEQENGVAELFLTLINVATKSGFTYWLCITDACEKHHFFALGARPTSFKSILPQTFAINGAIATGIFCIKDNLPIAVAFAREDGFDFSICEFKKAIAEKCLLDKKEQEKTNLPPIIENLKQHPKIDEIEPTIQPPYPPSPQPDVTKTPPQEFPSPEKPEQQIYDDEVVATENYYQIDQQIIKKLNTVKEWTYEKVRIEDGEPDFFGAQKETQNRLYADGIENEKNSCTCRQNQNEQPFFTIASKELDNVFDKFPPEQNLQQLFSQSKWAKINYSADKYYVVGIIKEKGKEKYICYGVPAPFSENPPEQLAGYCTFIPRSVFDVKGDGYWMMFQDALTGKCVTPTKVD